VKRWLRQTHGVKFELTRHFLAHMFDSELFAFRDQWQSVAVSALATILPASLLFGNYAAKYRHLASLPSPIPFRSAAVADELSLFTLLMALSGLVALLEWQSLFPSKRDFLAFAGLPIGARQVFIARFCAVLLFISVLVMVTNFLPSVVVPAQMMGRWQKNPSLVANIGAHAIAACLGCFFVFFSAMALQGALLHLLPRKLFARFSVYVQGAGMGICFLAALFSWTIGDWDAAMIGRLSHFGRWVPPVWFLGLHEALLGDGDAFFLAMKTRALSALMAATVITAVAYLFGYSRYRKMLIENPSDDLPHRRKRMSLLRHLSRDPRGEAVVDFMAKTLARSRVHRIVLLAYAGVAVGLVLNTILVGGSVLHWRDSWRGVLQFVILFSPIALTSVMLPGFRHVALLPAELSANWIFQLTESVGRTQWLAAVERFILFCVIAPIYVLLVPIAFLVLPWTLALRMSALQLLISLIIFELLYAEWQQLPFTCSYRPGKRPIVATLSRALALLGFAVPVLVLSIRAGSRSWQTFVPFGTVLIAIWIWARRRRLAEWRGTKLIYVDVEPVPGLGIGELTFRPAGVRTEDARLANQPVSNVDNCAPARAALEPRVAISLRLYRSLANAFPQEFRNAYGIELLHVTENAIETIWQRYGLWGLLRLLLDLAVRIPAEYFAELRRDFPYAVRTLAQSPAFTAVALLSLSLGICIATCSDSEMNGLIFRNIPAVSAPDELVAVQAPTSYPQYERYHEHSELFISTAAYVAPVPFGITLEGRTFRTWGHLVTPSYFSTLGIRPELGRTFDQQEERPGQGPTVVISYRFWKAYFGSESSVIGQTLRINGHPCTIIGVGPRDFLGASPSYYVADVWMPLAAGERLAPELADHALQRRDLSIFHVIARRQPGVTTSRAQGELEALARKFQQDFGIFDPADKSPRILLVPGGKILPLRKQDVPLFAEFFMVISALVLLIACSNVANMMLARAAARRREIAVRLALGASRGRLIRQLLTESMLIAVVAGVLGFMLSLWLMRALSHVSMPTPMPVTYDLSVDWRALVFAALVTLLTGVVFGLVPALQATRANVAPALKDGGNDIEVRHRRFGLRNLILVTQLAGSLTLLVILGLLSLGIQSTLGIQSGFDAKNLYLISIDPVRDGYSETEAATFFHRLLERAQRLPGVSAAALSDTVPVALAGSPGVKFSDFGLTGSAREVYSADRNTVGKDYFATVGIPILMGRAFRADDESDDATSVIVNEKLVHQYWPGQDPVGRRIEVTNNTTWGGFGAWPGTFDIRSRAVEQRRQVFQVVGVAGNVANDLVATKLHPAVYFSLHSADYAQPSLRGMTIMVRALPGVDAISEVQHEIVAIDPNITTFNARSMTEQIDQFMSPLKSASWTYGLVGVFGLILASVGLAGVTAYSVARRQHEISIRMALGAHRGHVLGLVMKEGALMVLVGTALGLLVAGAGLRVMSGLFASVASTSTTDPHVMLGAPLLLGAIALAACYVPARKSTSIDPAAVLRSE